MLLPGAARPLGAEGAEAWAAMGRAARSSPCAPVERDRRVAPPACPLARSWGGGRDADWRRPEAVGMQIGSAVLC